MTARLRVCIAADSPEPSGVAEHIATLIRHLRDELEFVVAAPPTTGLLDRAGALGAAVKSLEPGDLDPFGNWLRRSGIGLVHIHAGIGWEGHRLARAARDAGVDTIVRTEHLPYLLTDPVQIEEYRAGAGLIDRLVCVSDSVACSHRAAGLDASRIVTIANGIDPPRPGRTREAVRRELAMPDAPLLLMVGRLTPQKGQLRMLDALGPLLYRRPDVNLLLAGEGPLAGAIASRIAERGLAGHVRLLGARRDVPDLMAAADLLVLPSAFEGLPLVALEAMALGLPIVGTRVGGIEDAVLHGETGWLVGPDDGDALAALIDDVLVDARRMALAAAAGSDRYQAMFRAERMAAETLDLYRTLRPAPSRHRIQGTRRNRARLGFVGAGGIAERHFRVLEQFDDVEIRGVCDLDASRARNAAVGLGAEAFKDVETMLASVGVDALYICVPPFAHGAPERAAIERDLPFFVEKPVALDLATAEEVAAAVEARSLVTAVGYQWRYFDTVDEVRELLKTHPPQLVQGFWLDATPPPQWWWRDSQSGGQMIEQATHLLDIARYLVGEPVRVFGLEGHRPRDGFPGLDVPTVSSAAVHFASGAIGSFSSTCLLRWNHRVALHIFCDGLAIELTERDLMVDVGRGRPIREAKGDPVVRADRAFIDAVRGKRADIRCPYPEAVRTHRLGLAAVESARAGRAIELAVPEMADA